MLSLIGAALALSAPTGDEVTSLPGWNAALPSKHYSGYLNFGPNNRKHIHYWYVESTGRDPKDPMTPTVLWMNGGPGCSSLDGWYYEHGPFRGAPEDGNTLVENPASWAKLANMLYIESPVGVGFSYSDAPTEDYRATDDTAADDARDALKDFFAKFPELNNHPFFITGESYAGIYVPTTAEAILKDASWNGPTLTGIAVGNGCTGTETDLFNDKYSAEFFLGSSLVPPPLKDTIRATCGDFKNVTGKCEAALNEMYEGLVHINVYDVLAKCINTLPEQGLALDTTPLGLNHHKIPKQMLPQFARKTAAAGERGPTECIDTTAASGYFNKKEVMDALHVKPVDFYWTVCSSAAGWTYESTRPNLPRDTYPFLLENIRVLVYQGDLDGGITYQAVQAWTSGMGLPVAKPYHPWNFKLQGQTQVGGVAVTYEAKHDFSLVVIKGGRHEVPETAGDQALAMLDAFIKGERL